MILSLSLTIIFLISFTFTPIYRKYAIKKAILDNPNHRSSHTTPTPRGGGIAIAIAFYVGLTWGYFQGFVAKELFFALLAGVILIITGVFDDVLGLTPKIRFIVQLVTTIVALFFLHGLQKFNIGFTTFNYSLILNIIAAFGIVWFINLYNFIDGIDGYASMEAIFFGIAVYLLTGNIAALILLISTLGFLPWNWQQAKIFMGDVGSTMLGFTIAILGIYLQNTMKLSLTTWLALTSLFWFDATLTLVRRALNKETLSEAHRKHAFQRIVQAGFSHQKTTILGFIINFVIFGLVWFNQTYLAINTAITLGIVVVFLFMIYVLIEKKKSFFNTYYYFFLFLTNCSILFNS